MNGLTRVAAVSALCLTTQTHALMNASAGEQSGSFSQTCRYFDSMSFKERHTQGTDTLRTRLATDCREAFDVMQTNPVGTPPHARAETYLQGLETYRLVITDMATSRYDHNEAPGQARMVGRPVSRAGEILIAKVMGLLATQGKWREWRQASR